MPLIEAPAPLLAAEPQLAVFPQQEAENEVLKGFWLKLTPMGAVNS
ncbi:MAG: hypothetical protein V7K32_08210 [Nostoc sp.]